MAYVLLYKKTREFEYQTDQLYLDVSGKAITLNMKIN
jgi:hypothetical protein